jgi:hypothetical protein
VAPGGALSSNPSAKKKEGRKEGRRKEGRKEGWLLTYKGNFIEKKKYSSPLALDTGY